MPYRRISDEASLESFRDIWNWRTVSKALTIAQKGENRSPDHYQIFMAKGGQGRFPEMAVVRNGRRLKPLKPDWAGIKQPPDSHEQPPNILLGDTKLSCKWHSSRIQSGTVAEMGDIHNWLPAIRQIYTYCIKANAQYGYLITDQELLAVKISWLVGAGKKVPKASREEEAKRRQRNEILELESSSGTHGVTINLALWWLHMMAANGHEIEDQELTFKNDRQNSPDEDEALGRFGESEEPAAQTLSGSENWRSVDLKHGQSFRSETSNVRHILLATALDRDGRKASTTVAASRRKRTREEPDIGRDHSRARRRVNPSRSGKR
ncbi:MAG: hypothetical protein L6R42_002080 [Xanthoria sp. 1 TBL-2021]|nr:MAG: hypothetical protein L6R42_002080 [Xanthoria sp. 1 TBL-2021]